MRRISAERKGMGKGYKQLKDVENGVIITLKAEGYTHWHIAERLQRSKSCISAFLKKFDETGSSQRTHGSGRPPKLSPQDVKHIFLLVKRDRRISASKIRVDLDLTHVHERTITRIIRLFSPFKSKWCTKKPFISIKNIRHRIKWCPDHLDWTLDDWRHVIWSDESPFVLRSGVRFRVWCKPGERPDKRLCKGTVKHDKKINVWGCFAARGVGKLHRIHGIMDKHEYLDLLENVALPSPADDQGHHD